MGKAWLTWEGERDEHNNRSVLNIYTSYADTSMAWKSVQLVRVTSPSFRTTDSIGVYSGINSIKMKYSNVSLAGKYRDGSRILNIYEDRQSGIAFETANTGDQELCVAIVVFKAGESFVNTYIPYHENPL
jgi:hypothetical protein